MIGKVIIGFCIIASIGSLTFGAPFEQQTDKSQIGKLEQVHVCVPSDSCGSKSIIGINIEYSCSCSSGYTGEFCNTPAQETIIKKQIHSFVELTHDTIKAGQLFYCEYQSTKCVNGVTVIQSKNAICS